MPAAYVSSIGSPAKAAGAAIGPGRDLETEVASFAFAPPMTVHKFKTMQDRRVPVSIKCKFSKLVL